MAEALTPGGTSTVEGLRSSGHWLITYWIGAWVFLHFFAWPLWRCGCGSPSYREVYRMRLCRSQVYNAVAVVGGLHLLSRCRWHPNDLLFLYSPEHELLYSMAVAHWIVSIWEDMRCLPMLSAGLTKADMMAARGEMDPSTFLAKAYLVHHLMAALAFYAGLRLQACTGLCAFGLVFEFPVLWMNCRELAVCADTPPRWMREARALNRFWARFRLAFICARGIATFTYVYSVLFWSDSLNQLGLGASLAYHVMAVFFTLLNGIFYLGFMREWARKDARNLAALSCADAPGEDGPVEHAMASADAKPVDDKAQNRLQHVSEGSFRERVLSGQEVWIQVDEIVYNVTSYMADHPGGEAVLRQFAGKDATEPFRRARHSMRAKILMQKYCVGPLHRNPRRHRIFETSGCALSVLITAAKTALAYLVAVHLLTAVSGLWAPASSSATPSLAEMLLPGILLAAVAGGTALVPMALLGLFSVWRASLAAHLLACCTVLHFAGLILARWPASPDAAWEMPTAFELGAVGAFLLEEGLQLARPGARRYWSSDVFVGGALASAGLLLRGATPDALLATSDGRRVLAGALCLSISVVGLGRCGYTSSKTNRDDLLEEVLMGIPLAGLYCIGILAYLYYGYQCPDYYAGRCEEAAAALLAALSASSWSQRLGLWLSGVASLAALVLTFNTCYAYSQAWASRAWATTFAGTALLAGGLPSYRWLGWAALLRHLGSLAGRLRRANDEAVQNGTYADLDIFVLGTRELWDIWTAAVGTGLWQLVMYPMVGAVNLVLPEEFCVWGCYIPIFDLGEDVDLGVAAYIAPPAAKVAQGAPEHFVCNVGHVDSRSTGGMKDVQLTSNTLREVWAEFRRPDTAGLLANIVCLFPNVGGTYLTKEINLSCWETAADAHNWYVKSAAHRRITRQHSGGGLRTFGNLLASMRPVAELRHQDRCRRCCRLVEDPTPGSRAPRLCGNCGGATFGYQFF